MQGGILGGLWLGYGSRGHLEGLLRVSRGLRGGLQRSTGGRYGAGSTRSQDIRRDPWAGRLHRSPRTLLPRPGAADHRVAR